MFSQLIAGVSNSNIYEGHIWTIKGFAGRKKRTKSFITLGGPHAARGPRVWDPWLIAYFLEDYLTIVSWLSAHKFRKRNISSAGYYLIARAKAMFVDNIILYQYTFKPPSGLQNHDLCSDVPLYCKYGNRNFKIVCSLAQVWLYFKYWYVFSSKYRT